VEALVRGKSSVTIGGDLDYTLRAFPNHHRALMAAVRYGEKTHSPRPPGLGMSIECYFDRALRFRADDTVARMIYARYLASQNRPKEAADHLQMAASAAKGNALTHYNAGLIYFEMKDYENALVQAHKALELGLGSTALKDQLKSVGRWREPAAAAGATAASEPAS
jgi:tetratricopeptide (TPR) repeat protein